MARKTYFFLCFLIVNWPGITFSRAVPNRRLRSDGITHIKPEKFSDCFKYPNAKEIVIDGLTHAHWNQTAFEKLISTKYLTLINGTIPMITFRSSKLSSLSILQTNLDWFDVWREKNPTLKILQISRNRLQEVPSNINNLVGLTSLDLSQNELEYVDMQKLGSMKQLRTLDLSVNKIVLIDAEPSLRLSNLRNLDVSYNKLERFDDVFPRAFPVLDTIRLIGNKWTCEWVDRARRNIMDRRIVTFGVDYGCEEHRQGGLCCYGDLVMGGTTEASLREGSLVQEISKLVNDLAEKPLAAFSSDQATLELLTRNDGQDKILVGVKLDDVKVFLP